MEEYHITITYMDSKTETFVLKRDIAWCGHQYRLVTEWAGDMEQREVRELFIPMANVRRVESYRVDTEMVV